MKQRRAALVDVSRAFLALGWTTLVFRLGGRRAVARTARRAMASMPAGAAAIEQRGADLWRAYRAVRRAKRLWPGRVMCLQTALTLQAVLRARGIPATVRIGVRCDGGDVKAHAWIETGGYVLDDARLAGEFTAFEHDGLVKVGAA